MTQVETGSFHGMFLWRSQLLSKFLSVLYQLVIAAVSYGAAFGWDNFLHMSSYGAMFCICAKMYGNTGMF